MHGPETHEPESCWSFGGLVPFQVVSDDGGFYCEWRVVRVFLILQFLLNAVLYLSGIYVYVLGV